MARKKRILIIGGGFAGLYAARRLYQRGQDRVEIELISAQNYFTFQPLLPEVAGGTIATADAVSPLRFLLSHIKIRQAQVRSVNFNAHTVDVVDAAQGLVTQVPYHHLVLAPGQSADFSRFPGLQEHALSMKTLADAYRLRNHIISTLEQADVATCPHLKRRLLTYVAVGGGFSGVETVGEMEHMISGLLRFYPNINEDEIRIILIEYSSRILNEMPEKLAVFAHKRLEKRRVKILLNTGVSSASAYRVHLDGGRDIETMTVVATIGTAPSPLVAGLGLDMKWGRIKTNPTMRVPGLPNVWAIGDAALVPLPGPVAEQDNYAGMTAQFATRQGKQVADNILAVMSGDVPKIFAFRPLGALASIGHHRGVAHILGLRISGSLAWFIWRALYLGMLPGIATKLRVMSNWFLDHFLPRRAVHLEQWRRPAAAYVRFVKGDHVLRPGMVAQGFYTILDGSFDLKIPNPQTGKTYHRVLKKGDHFGERVIFDPSLPPGDVIAREESLCMVFERDDFLRFARGFSFLEHYFHDYIKSRFPTALQPDSLKQANTPSGKSPPPTRTRQK